MKAQIDFPQADGSRLRLAFSQPTAILTAYRREEIVAVIAAAEHAAHSGRWVVGCVAYEAAPAFDAAPARLPIAAAVAAAAATAEPATARTLEQAEIDMIRATLDAAGGNISLASKQLGISRNTIYRKLRWNAPTAE